MDETASDEAAGSSVAAGLATGRFARRCIAIASGEIGALALPLASTLPSCCAGETCACSRAAVPPSSPETAAVKTSDFIVLFIADPLLRKIDYDRVIARGCSGYRESLYFLLKSFLESSNKL
jgi:hypothetical protein